MAIHWDDLKASAKEFLSELRGQRIGIIGFTMVAIMILIGAFAPIIAPQVNVEWSAGEERWSNNPASAQPVWIDYLTTKSYSHQKEMGSYSYRSEKYGGNTKVYTWNLSMDDDVPYKDIILDIEGTCANMSNADVILERPDYGFLFSCEKQKELEEGKLPLPSWLEYQFDQNQELAPVSGRIVKGDGDIWWLVVEDEKLFKIEEDNGQLEIYKQREWTLMSYSDEIAYNNTFDIRLSTARSKGTENSVQKNIRRDYVKPYLMEQEGMSSENITELVNMKTTKVLFGKANEDWLDDTDPLKGDYQLKVLISGKDIELDKGKSKVILAGSVFGLMGTDSHRKNIFKGWVWGARYGLIAGGIVAIITIIIGTFYGMTSAYYGGWVDELMQRGNEIMMGIPTFPILIMVLKFISNSIWMFVLIYSLLMWRGIAKIIRSRGLQVRQDTYVEAAEALGSSSGRIIRSHMIPQILPYAVAEAALMVPIIIITEAGLHILGLGDPTIVTWGTILNEARSAGATSNFTATWYWVLMPGLGMIFLGFGFIATGMAVEKIVNPKMQQR